MATKDTRTELQKLMETDLSTVIVLDTETTGFGPSTEILELGMLSGKGDLLWESLYKPSWTDWWGHAEKVHGITAESVENEKALYQDMRAIRSTIAGKSVCLYNKKYDQALFPDHLHKAGEVICVMEAWQQFKDLSKWAKLVDAAEECGHDWSANPPHSAVGDCFATLTVLKHIKAAKGIS